MMTLLLVAPLSFSGMAFASGAPGANVNSGAAATPAAGTPATTSTGTVNGLSGSCPPGTTGCISDSNAGAPDPAASSATCANGNCDLVAKYLNPTISVLSVMIGIAAVISYIIAGIQYSSSAGDPQKAAKARSRIISTTLALVAYIFFYAFLEFLIPGGILNAGA